ncbi:MAG: hypothetical protein IJ668_10625 [Selenomonadaceae bacterium]|nr:hypothetical protein [Selenomonadaceae bacterium]
MSFTTILGNLIRAAIPFFVEIGQKIFGRLNEAPPLNDNATINDVEQIGNALCELRAQVLEQSRATIDNANDALKFYIEEQLFSLEDRSELLSKYDISSRSVERRMEDIQHRLNAFWKDALNRRISLDDEECRSILMLPTSAKKTAELERFTNAVLDETLEEYAELVRAELSELYVDMEDDLERSLKRVERNVEEYDAIVKSLDAGDNDRFEELIARARVKIACCDAIVEKVGA